MGVFISFEGIDGSGKSTQVKLLAESLMKEGVNCLATREPGGTQFGEKIRSLLLDEDCTINNWAQTFLFLADRAQHLEEIIRPALEKNYWIISDRFMESTLAYQGYAGSIDRDFIMRAHEIIVGTTLPKITFILDCSLEVSRMRLSKRKRRRYEGLGKRGKPDRYENLNDSFQKKLREAFLDLARKDLDRLIVVDANLSAGEIHSHIIRILRKRNLWPSLK